MVEDFGSCSFTALTPGQIRFTGTQTGYKPREKGIFRLDASLFMPEVQPKMGL